MAEPAGADVDEWAVRRNVRWLLLAVVACSLLGVAGGVVAAVVHGHRGAAGGHRHLALAVVVTVAVVVVGLGTAAVTMMVLLRRPEYRRVMQFGWFERRRVQKAVKAGRPLSPRELQVARASRDYLVRFRRPQWIWPLLAVVWLFDGLTHRGAARWLMIAGAVVYAALVPVAIVQWRRATVRYDAALARWEPPPA